MLAWGKVRRFIYHFAFPGYIRRSHERRTGECARCGACCKLLHLCPFLEGGEGNTSCRIHWRRARNCRIFPIDERDLKDRDIVSPDVLCGYSFLSEKKKVSLQGLSGLTGKKNKI